MDTTESALMKVSIDGGAFLTPFQFSDFTEWAITNHIRALIYGPPGLVQVSFGHFTFLDAYSPCKDSACRHVLLTCERTPVNFGLVKTGVSFRDYAPFFDQPSPTPAQYWDPIGTDQASHIWGQGSELVLHSYKEYFINLITMIEARAKKRFSESLFGE